MPATLLTFAPMIDCECSRFLLTHYGVDYREEPHVFGWVSALGLLHGKTPQVPQLYGGGGPTCVGPRAIVDHYETICAPGKRLIPANAMDAMQVNADWSRFNGILAGAAAPLAYYHLLPFREIMIDPFTRGVPAAEAALVRAAYPAFRGLFTLLLRLSPATARDALEQIRVIFEETDRRIMDGRITDGRFGDGRIGDGRGFLVGDGLTLGDIALATACAPLVLPPNYAAPIPPFARMPDELRAIVMELRQRPTGKFAARIFKEFRLAPA